MKSVFTFEFGDEDYSDRIDFLKKLGGNYYLMLHEFEELLRTFRKHGNAEFGALTEEQEKLYDFISKKYYEMKSESGVDFD